MAEDRTLLPALMLITLHPWSPQYLIALLSVWSDPVPFDTRNFQRDQLDLLFDGDRRCLCDGTDLLCDLVYGRDRDRFGHFIQDEFRRTETDQPTFESHDPGRSGLHECFRRYL